ncbi:MAG: TIGR03013 family XrtA/PEP-CTERM system glycosyltransferase [Pseudomonadota bacterium]
MSIFGHYISRGAIMLTVVEALIFGSVFLLFGYFLLGGVRGETIVDFAMDVALPTGIVMICLLVAGGYRLEAWKSPRTMARRVAGGAVGGSAAIVFFHDVMTGAGSVSYNLVVAVIVGCLIACAGRWISGRSRRVQNYLDRKVLVLGTGQQAATLNAVLKSDRVSSVSFAGFLHHSQELDATAAVDGQLSKEDILQTDMQLADYAALFGIKEIVVALDSTSQGLPERALLDCRLRGISVVDSISFIERETGRIGLDSVDLRWLVFSPGFRYGRARTAIKRLCDVMISSILLILLAPAMLATVLAVRWDSPGPAVFKQTRVGLGGKAFIMYKFRSMRQDAEADGKARWAVTNDNRITKIGHVLRMSRLDELPQLYNVLRGDMSLVGPRPERPEFVEGLSQQIPFYNERHSVRPGITGWAQTSFSYASSIEDTKTKLEYDLYYVKNHSLFLDILVLLQTLRVAVRGEGAR